MIYNQIVTWTAFAILAMFYILYLELALEYSYSEERGNFKSVQLSKSHIYSKIYPIQRNIFLSSDLLHL